jgi:hypothetical protein
MPVKKDDGPPAQTAAVDDEASEQKVSLGDVLAALARNAVFSSSNQTDAELVSEWLSGRQKDKASE